MNSRWRFPDLDPSEGYHFTLNLMDFVKKNVVSNMDDSYSSKRIPLLFLNGLVFPLFSDI